jgi:hypothetical protein
MAYWDPIRIPIKVLSPQKGFTQGHNTAIGASRALAARRTCGSCRYPQAGRLPSGPELVSATPLAIEPFLELDLSDGPRRVQIDALAPRAPDATPPSHKREILEERGFDRQDVKSGHVPVAVDPLEHENLNKSRIVGVRGHGP